MKLTKQFLAALLLATCTSAAMACSKPEAPALPDPDTAVTPQMVKAKNDVKAFLADAEAYLKCNISTKQHNNMVDKMKSVAADFNKIVRAYKSRMAG
ncbi:hypothetical protein HBA55_16200 [Pseudomaricurvus alkylphenolicus]|jgi:hypothetical protein|uniref:hypothetical protein n=1 Tax=Pseudomaricurvus alkylphenolicus TaxID=1306991 RepID=UPI001421E843|nr:hypothetical protein [Pseudomaricurvus alkylphenolicus]NIB41146.1 hypothetical protein [Pseudomaricurvus alkylphenolicus]